MDHGQSHPRPFAPVFGGKKRIKNLFEHTAGHAAAGIPHGQPHLGAGLQFGMIGHRLRIRITQAHFKDPALLPHGMGRVGDEVHQQLIDLDGITENRCGFRFDLPSNFDGCGQGCS